MNKVQQRRNKYKSDETCQFRVNLSRVVSQLTVSLSGDARQRLELVKGKQSVESV